MDNGLHAEGGRGPGLIIMYLFGVYRDIKNLIPKVKPVCLQEVGMGMESDVAISLLVILQIGFAIRKTDIWLLLINCKLCYVLPF